MPCGKKMENVHELLKVKIKFIIYQFFNIPILIENDQTMNIILIRIFVTVR